MNKLQKNINLKSTVVVITFVISLLSFVVSFLSFVQARDANEIANRALSLQALQQRPYVSLEPVKNQQSKNYITIKNDHIEICFKLTNVGQSIAKSIKFTESMCGTAEYFLKENKMKINSQSKVKFPGPSDLAPNQSIFPCIDFTNSNWATFNAKLNIEITYSNIFDTSKIYKTGGEFVFGPQDVVIDWTTMD